MSSSASVKVWLRQARAIMLGMAIGDALGTTSEGFAPFDYESAAGPRQEATIAELLETRGLTKKNEEAREWPAGREWPRDLVGSANHVTHTRMWAPGEVSDDTQTALAILRVCLRWQKQPSVPPKLALLLDEFQRWAAWSPDVGYTMFRVFTWFRARRCVEERSLIQADTAGRASPMAR